MAEADRYRPLTRMDLRSVYTSMGVPENAFQKAAPKTPAPLFDAVLNADASRPNGLWLFKGSEYFLYNLLTGAIEEGPKPIAGNWGGASLPQLFRTGIHSALWDGPAFPNLWVFFKDEMYVVMNSTLQWAVQEGPRGVLGAWATGAWTNPDGTWRTPGVPTALHGLGSQFEGMVHFFKDGEYIRHNLKNGATDLGPVAVKSEWKLPEPFTSRIDHAFYGTGPNEEHIYFLSGDQYCLYDFRLKKVIDSGEIEDKFPAFAQFLGRPQLFLVQDYTLETLVGPPHLGRLIDTRSIGAGSTIKKILVTETTDTTKTSIARSLLESQDSAVVSNFYDRVDKNTATTEDSERYKYQLNAAFHGDASANSLWGGEVNAQLAVQGGTDTLREGFSEATFKSIGSQVDDSKRQTEQKTYNSETEILSNVKVLKKEIFEETNASDRVRVYEFYEQLQPYITLLALRRVRLAYSDGTDRPRVVDLPTVDDLLDDVLVDPELRQKVLSYLRGELDHVSDHLGEVRTVLADGRAASLTMKSGLTTTYAVQATDGTSQALQVPGVVTADRSWIEPTFTITCVQRD